ncbi:MAG: dTDP-4-dehydrorhamnose 3,5-epimerase [Candidatus Delongbacteria bacterium]|nr:dTDP-4-dehydrorhamnose 3,5-epimerase [Candidatus Delongbacteria bacterium]
MNFRVEETGIKGLNIIETKLYSDNRGYFFESFNKAQFSEIGINFDFIQDNISKSAYGVIRGLHYQLDPASQTKLLTVLSGKILDVAVDLRKNSSTFGKHFSIKLEAGDGKMILIPKGFAHGFASLSDDTVILYKCDNLYSPEHERGIIYNDPDLGIDWNISSSDTVITERDLRFPGLRDAEMNF